jgi:oligopeptide/dipeptide ABC transporter ATP-binding protein
MKQRALIALSLVLEPGVLVLDEPTASLDLLMQRSILTLLNDLKERYDLTLVFITHDLPLLTKIADRLAIMYAFEFVEFGTTSDVLEGSAHPYTRMLLKSTPNVTAPIEEMQAIEGQSPDPVDTPEGCSYHPRCPLADGQCRAEAPKLFEISETHESACYYWDEADSVIPTTWMEGVK